jgi:YesN/AraC family two-component response regulator
MMNTKNNPFQNKNTTSIKVLLVDDNKRTRKGLRAMLATAHLNPFEASCTQITIVGEAENGQKALQMVETTQPNVVIMDLQMPIMDGLQATKKIKAAFPNVKIIILTIYADSRTTALEASADAFLIKGCNTTELIDTIYSLHTNIHKQRKEKKDV